MNDANIVSETAEGKESEADESDVEGDVAEERDIDMGEVDDSVVAGSDQFEDCE